MEKQLRTQDSGEKLEAKPRLEPDCEGTRGALDACVRACCVRARARAREDAFTCTAASRGPATIWVASRVSSAAAVARGAAATAGAAGSAGSRTAVDAVGAVVAAAAAAVAVAVAAVAAAAVAAAVAASRWPRTAGRTDGRRSAGSDWRTDSRTGSPGYRR